MNLKQYKIINDTLGLDSDTTGLESLKGLPFWNSADGHNFNTAISLPQKNGQSLPLFDYELDIVKALSETKHVFIVK